MAGKGAKRMDRMMMCISECVIRFECAESPSEAFWGVSPPGPVTPTDAVRSRCLL